MTTLEDLASKHKLDLILIFGSQARGEARPASDMDIAVYGRQIFSETEKIQLIYELCDIGLFLNCQPKNAVRSKYHF